VVGCRLGRGPGGVCEKETRSAGVPSQNQWDAPGQSGTSCGSVDEGGLEHGEVNLSLPARNEKKKAPKETSAFLPKQAFRKKRRTTNEEPLVGIPQVHRASIGELAEGWA